MTSKTERTCPECGEKVGAGIVRHPRCFQEALEKRLGPVPKAKLVPGRMYCMNGGGR
nr:MAG TPA: zinc-ribbon containing domain protein [Caudoviricetes sp.]